MPERTGRARKVAVNTTIDRPLLAEVDEYAREQERPRSEIIREALQLWVDTQRQEAEVDRRLAEVAEQRMADDDEWLSHDEVKARAGEGFA